MLPDVRRVLWSACIPALVSGVVAAAVCLILLPKKDKPAATASLTRNMALYKAAHHPPVPVSSPLVLPSVQPFPPAAKAPVVTSAQVRDALNLPSFAPLVHQVIPAVVNISISHSPSGQDDGSGDGDASPQGVGGQGADSSSDVEPDASAVAPHPTPKPHSVAPHTVRKKRHVHQLHNLRNIHRRVVRPADDDLSGAGSGFVVDASGVIVTNRHVVGNATRVMVSLSDGRSLPAHILGDDPMTDIAVIKVDSETPLPCVTWGDSHQVEIGDWVLVAGNPFGFGSSVTAGIVSAVGRDLGIGALDDFMQLDAPINPGNSGGPAFNLQGQVVAVNAAIASPSDGSVGIGFGIPAEIVAPVVESIEKTGHVEHGWLGVTLNDATSPMWIEDVDPHGAAWLGGLRKKDAILAIGHIAVHDARTVLRSVAAAHPGTIFNFTIRRHGEVMTLPVTLGKRPVTDL